MDGEVCFTRARTPHERRYIADFFASCCASHVRIATCWHASRRRHTTVFERASASPLPRTLHSHSPTAHHHPFLWSRPDRLNAGLAQGCVLQLVIHRQLVPRLFPAHGARQTVPAASPAALSRRARALSTVLASYLLDGFVVTCPAPCLLLAACASAGAASRPSTMAVRIHRRRPGLGRRFVGALTGACRASLSKTLIPLATGVE
jgi:hypothetical protein